MIVIPEKIIYRSRTIEVDFCHRFTVINMKDIPVPISQIHSFHLYVAVVNSAVFFFFFFFFFFH